MKNYTFIIKSNTVMYLLQFMAYEILGLVKSQPICIDTILPIKSVSFLSVNCAILNYHTLLFIHFMKITLG